jgi:two-component system response regulator PilR (NtrC family)
MSLIVVVDDDPLFTQTITTVLTLAGYIVSAHLTFAGAEEFIRANTVDALVADLHLKDGNGWDLIELAREQQPDLGVVVVSGYYDALAEENARRFGVAVLTKPFNPDDLISVVDGITRGT